MLDRISEYGYNQGMKEKLLKKLNADLKKEGSLLALSDKTKIPYASLWRMVRGGGGMKNWEKYEAYLADLRSA